MFCFDFLILFKFYCIQIYDRYFTRDLYKCQITLKCARTYITCMHEINSVTYSLIWSHKSSSICRTFFQTFLTPPPPPPPEYCVYCVYSVGLSNTFSLVLVAFDENLNALLFFCHKIWGEFDIT